MGRSGYSEDCENLGLWRGAVARAIADDVVRDSEHVCAMGAVIVARGIDVSQVDVYDAADTADLLGVAGALAAGSSGE
jgi:hypothetical protein